MYCLKSNFLHTRQGFVQVWHGFAEQRSVGFAQLRSAKLRCRGEACAWKAAQVCGAISGASRAKLTQRRSLRHATLPTQALACGSGASQRQSLRVSRAKVQRVAVVA